MSTKTDLHNETEMDHLMVAAVEKPHPRLVPMPLETKELRALATGIHKDKLSGCFRLRLRGKQLQLAQSQAGAWTSVTEILNT